MKALRFAPALLLLAIACPAQAKGFAWCQVNGGNYQAYLSGIVEIDDSPEAYQALSAGAFGKGFQDYVRASLDPKASGIECTRQDSLFYAQDYIDVLVIANPGYKFVKTGWRGKVRMTASGSGRTAALRLER